MIYLFLALVSVVIAFSSWLNLGLGVFAYLWTGFCIWTVLEAQPSLLRIMFLWWPAILFDKPEWCE